MAHQRRAVDHIRRGAFELRVGEQDEPGPKRGAIRFIGEPDLRGDRAAEGNHQHDRKTHGTSETLETFETFETLETFETVETFETFETLGTFGTFGTFGTALHSLTINPD
ncbi:MAG TPA: hypothetical protein VFV51_17435, partial [Vicinamibacterales bacterium]|nr:hypothetical protein [Vicinamibacterales bacterium]